MISVIANSHQSLRSQREGRPQEGKCKVEALNMDLSKKTLKSVDQAHKDAHLPACRLLERIRSPSDATLRSALAGF